jgi:hypothetical protein
VVQQRDEQFARDFEGQIATDIENLRREMIDATEAADEVADERGLEDSLRRAQDLVRGTESLSRRLENRGQQGQQGQQGEGQQGQQGEGQQGEGQQGQQGEGQQGQQGEGQQGQQGEGQQGQQGQGQQGQQGQGGDQQGQGQQGQAGGQGQGQQGGEEGRRLDPNQQGQEGQQGGQQGGQAGQQGGQRGGGDGFRDARSGNFDPNNPGGGATRGDPEPFTEEEIRQYQREFEQRATDARELRQELAGQGWDLEDLDEAIRAMERLGATQTWQDLPNIAALQEQIQESLRRMEFGLRREVEGESTGRAALSGSDEVPAGFRNLVEEYYKSLARGGGGGR